MYLTYRLDIYDVAFLILDPRLYIYTTIYTTATDTFSFSTTLRLKQ